MPVLPGGVTIATALDRSDLIARAVDTLKHALVEEVLLVTLAHIVFLWHFRSILIVTAPLPLTTPVSGGMVSSLLHALVVTPVIFLWLRERELGAEGPEAE